MKIPLVSFVSAKTFYGGTSTSGGEVGTFKREGYQ